MMTEQIGIVLDCSHDLAADLDFGIVWYAHKLGWDGGQTDIPMLARDWAYYENGETPDDYTDEEDFIFSFREALYMAAEDAVDWLNETVAEDGHCYVIDDNSLYYWPTEV